MNDKQKSRVTLNNMKQPVIIKASAIFPSNPSGEHFSSYGFLLPVSLQYVDQMISIIAKAQIVLDNNAAIPKVDLESNRKVIH